MDIPEVYIKHVLIVDDHAVLRDGIKLMLTTLEPDIAVYEAATAAEAFNLVQHFADLDLVLLDLDLPDDNQGLQTLDTLCKLLPVVPIIVLSANEKTSTVQETIKLGAKGYLPKSSPQQIMHNAIRLVLAGGIYIPPTTLDTTGEIESGSVENIQDNSRKDGLSDRLTPRQIEILKLIAQGKTNNEIAHLLSMSAATVRTHLTMIFKRMGVKNRTEAGHIAHKLGLDLDV